MGNEIEREIGIHGGRWEELHGGYFSDPGIAAFLVREVITTAAEGRPTVLTDLGGGTGFLLSQLSGAGINPEIRLVNLDLSARQLARTPDPLISVLQASLSSFRRGSIAGDKDRLMCVMRSALHYFGKNGMANVLRHLRKQMKKGEWFVHQTACFTSKTTADCINTIYSAMASEKWYPMVGELITLLDRTGWEVTRVVDAPSLRFYSNELKERYRLREETIVYIRDLVQKRYGEISGTYRETPEGFVAFLPYKIFRCRAV